MILFGKVKPQLHDDVAIPRERPFQLLNAPHLVIEVLLRHLFESEIHNRFGIPRTKHDTDGTARRHRAPETPETRALALLIGLVPVSMGLYITGIEPAVEFVHHFTLARAFNA